MASGFILEAFFVGFNKLKRDFHLCSPIPFVRCPGRPWSADGVCLTYATTQARFDLDSTRPHRSCVGCGLQAEPPHGGGKAVQCRHPRSGGRPPRVGGCPCAEVPVLSRSSSDCNGHSQSVGEVVLNHRIGPRKRQTTKRLFKN